MFYLSDVMLVTACFGLSNSSLCLFDFLTGTATAAADNQSK